jgi:hypothetical protein
MKTYLVAWELDCGDNCALRHARFLGRLASFGKVVDTGIGSAPLIASDWSASQVAAFLRETQSSGDRLLVVRLDHARVELSSALTEEASRWLLENRRRRRSR